MFITWKNIDFINNIQLYEVHLHSVATDSLHTCSKSDLHRANYGTTICINSNGM